MFYFSFHIICNKTHQDEKGKQARHRRKTDEPNPFCVEIYIKHKLMENLEQVRAVKNKYRIPIPNPNHSRSKINFINPPESVEEVKEYCKKRNNNVDAEKFYESYKINKS